MQPAVAQAIALFSALMVACHDVQRTLSYFCEPPIAAVREPFKAASELSIAICQLSIAFRDATTAISELFATVIGRSNALSEPSTTISDKPTIVCKLSTTVSEPSAASEPETAVSKLSLAVSEALSTVRTKHF